MSLGTIIVTGAGGLLGSHLLPLLGATEKIHALGRTPPAVSAPNVVPGALDLSRPLDRDALPERADSIVYLAQSNRYRDFPAAAGDIFQVNTAQLAAMLDYAQRSGVRRFVYASTGSVYGSGGTFSEESPVPPAEPLGFYPASKLCGELLASSYARLMSITILRFFFIYGLGQKADMLIPRLVESVRAGRSVTLQGEEGIRINPIHVSDAAAATAAALSLDGLNRINVAGPEVVSIRRICETAGDLLGAEPVFVHQDAVPRDLIGDTALMERLLHRPATRPAEGLRDLV